MNRISKYFKFICITFTISACSQILETVDLAVDTKDNNKQEEFKVIEKTLTLDEANKQKNAAYNRTLMKSGVGDSAKPIKESFVLKSNFPKEPTPSDYIIGIGDEINYIRLIDNKNKDMLATNSWPPDINEYPYRLGIGDELVLRQISEEEETPLTTTSQQTETDNNPFIAIPREKTQTVIESSGRVGSDGSVLLLEVGRLDAQNKTLNDLRSEVRNIFIRNGEIPRFQLEIAQFRSHRAYLTINDSSRVVPLSDQPTNLREILTRAGKGLTPGVKSNVKLQRSNAFYLMDLREIFEETAPTVIIQDRDHIFVEDVVSTTSKATAVVSYDGTIVLEGLGKFNVAGKSLKDFNKEISNLVNSLPDSKNTFQIELIKFRSKTAFLNISGKSSSIIEIGAKPRKLKHILAQNGLAIDTKAVTLITLKRKNSTYSFNLRELLSNRISPVYIIENDTIIVDKLPYKPNKVFILGGVSPQIVNIDPSLRESLADLMFTQNGILSSVSAKRSELYLLRGKSPIVAYHLDAQSPTRLIVAENMELRPNDIIYVAEQPIASFNKALGTIAPLRLLLRDLNNNDFP